MKAITKIIQGAVDYKNIESEAGEKEEVRKPMGERYHEFDRRKKRTNEEVKKDQTNKISNKFFPFKLVCLRPEKNSH